MTLCSTCSRITVYGMATGSCRKRKRVVLSLENKLAILDRLEKGETKTKLAKEFSVANSTLTGLKKNESKIREYLCQ